MQYQCFIAFTNIFNIALIKTNTQAIMSMTSKKVMVYIFGQMEENMMDNGVTESNMEKGKNYMVFKLKLTKLN